MRSTGVVAAILSCLRQYDLLWEFWDWLELLKIDFRTRTAVWCSARHPRVSRVRISPDGTVADPTGGSKLLSGFLPRS